MRKKTSYLRGCYRDSHDSGDKWASCMAAFFDIAAELYFRDPDSVPSEWMYRPGAYRNSTDDPRESDCSIFAEDCKTAEIAELVEFGLILNRYADKLRVAGKSY